MYGDEVPGICAAIWAKKTLGAKGKVAIVRSNYASAPLGGLLTRGGLAYIDLDKIPDWYRQPYAQCFKEFLDKANAPESCLDPKLADRASQTDAFSSPSQSYFQLNYYSLRGR